MNSTEWTDKIATWIVETTGVEVGGVNWCPYVDWANLNTLIIAVQNDSPLIGIIEAELEELRQTAAFASKKYPNRQEHWGGVAAAYRHLAKAIAEATS